MKSETGHFFSDDGLRLHYRFHRNPDAERTLVIMHGHGEHAGRYEKFASILAAERLSIAVYDARGAGKSEGREVYVETLEDYLRDLTAFMRHLGDHLSDQPIVLLGHSLGALVSMHWALRFPHKITRLILSSPCFGIRLPSPLILMNDFLNRFVPALVYQNPVYPPHLTHNPEEVENYKKDLLIKRKISVRLLSEMIRYGNLVDSEPDIDFPFPVFFLMAGLEKVVDKERTLRIFDRIKAPNKKIRIFEGFYHEIFNELGQEKVFEALKGCLSQDA